MAIARRVLPDCPSVVPAQEGCHIGAVMLSVFVLNDVCSFFSRIRTNATLLCSMHRTVCSYQSQRKAKAHLIACQSHIKHITNIGESHMGHIGPHGWWCQRACLLGSDFRFSKSAGGFGLDLAYLKTRGFFWGRVGGGVDCGKWSARWYAVPGLPNVMNE